jgi:RNA polymerase sigma factor (sigma-70 family)
MDDLKFIQRCVGKDKSAWDKFVDRYSRLIYSSIHSVLKTKGANLTQENINDLFQEIFLSLIKDNFKKLKSFKARNKCSLASWLRQVAVNFTIDFLRKDRILLSIDEETNEEYSLKDILRDGSVSADDALDDSERFNHLIDCISRLDKDDKYFLELHINRDIGLEELKNLFRVSRGAIDMRKSRIVDRLRDCFEGKGFELDF